MTKARRIVIALVAFFATLAVLLWASKHAFVREALGDDWETWRHSLTGLASLAVAYVIQAIADGGKGDGDAHSELKATVGDLKERLATSKFILMTGLLFALASSVATLLQPPRGLDGSDTSLRHTIGLSLAYAGVSMMAGLVATWIKRPPNRPVHVSVAGFSALYCNIVALLVAFPYRIAPSSDGYTIASADLQLLPMIAVVRLLWLPVVSVGACWMGAGIARQLSERAG